MPRSNFFANLGLFAVNDFLDAQTCARLRADMSAARVSMAMIDNDVVDESFRRVGSADVHADSVSLVGSRLSVLRPRLEAHFGVALKGFEDPQFLVYGPGGFYRPHKDANHHAKTPDYMRNRKVSVVIFLNEESETAPDGYVGGKLAFHGLMRGSPQFEACRFPLIAEAGLLIAFRSDILHEVTPVTAGTRHTIVTWYS